MYDELVERLHNAPEDMSDGWAVALVMEAADAIEELRFTVECMKHENDCVKRED